MDYSYIDNDQALAEFCESVSDCRYCALDTEFVREKTYFPVLALVQLATETHQACIDPLAISDFSPLVALFEIPDMLKILHSPSQDMELFLHEFKSLPTPMFDTQLAAAVLGYANQIGYADLVKRLCGVQLDKKHTRANWAKRPLSEGELDYAMDDVRYLIEMQQKLQDQLQQRGRLTWVQADFERMTREETYRLDETRQWKRLKGVQRLKGKALNNADQLCRWRERRAIDRNRPRRWIMKDEDIVDIARFSPTSHHDLEQIGNLSKDYVKKNGDAILKVLSEASKIDPSDYPRQDEILKLSNQQQALADCLMAMSRVICERNDISLASVTTKKEIDRLVSGEREIKLCAGWRHEMLGRYLEGFLDGDLVLSVSDGRLDCR